MYVCSSGSQIKFDTRENPARGGELGSLFVPTEKKRVKNRVCYHGEFWL